MKTKYSYLKLAILIFIAAAFIQMTTVTCSFAAPRGEGWFVADDAEPVGLEEARIYFNQRVQQLARRQLREIGAVRLRRRDDVVITPEIEDLARGLHYDPMLIYDYVHNNIEYVPYFGLHKGATMTLLDGSGNDFDQAALLVALFRASDIEAQFVYGTMYIPGAWLRNWLGGMYHSNEHLAWRRVSNVLAWGGIPHSIRYNDGSAYVARIWVRAVIDDEEYVFDPLYKAYRNYEAEIDEEEFFEVAGYNRGDFLSAVSEGAEIEEALSVQNLNEGNLSGLLEEYAHNLIEYIKEEYFDWHVLQLFGGRYIGQTYLDELPQELPFPVWNPEAYDEIPEEYIATLQVECHGIDHTIETPDIMGKRLTITFAGDNLHPELRADGELLAQGNATEEGHRYDCTVTIDHPYPYNDGEYCDQASTYSVRSNGSFNYAIIIAYGTPSDRFMNKCQKKLSDALSQGLDEASESVLGETLNVMGMTFMQETMRTFSFLGVPREMLTYNHHCIGMMMQEEGYHIDVKQASFSVNDVSVDYENAENRTAYYNSIWSMASAFEHGVLEQLMGSDNPGISTVKIFHLANQAGDRLFWATSDTFDEVQEQLENYSEHTLNQIREHIEDDNIVILPENGSIEVEDWTGSGYIYRIRGGYGEGLIIDGGYFGGYAARIAQVACEQINELVEAMLPDFSELFSLDSFLSEEPVDMTSGAYVYENTDLALGGTVPLGLSFSRSYNSSNYLTDRGLGYGWTHNYDIRLTRTGHPNPGLGTRTPVEAAALFTVLQISYDLMQAQDDIVVWTVVPLMHKWMVDQLIDNSIVVQMGSQSMEYIKLPDGSYAAPPGITTELIENDDTFSLRERFGTQIDFDDNDRAVRLQDIDGNELTFTYSDERLASVQDTFERTLNFTYSDGKISAVVDSAERSVSYEYDEENNLVSFTDVGGNEWHYGYDENHRMASLENPLGITTAENEYDRVGLVASQTVPRQGDEDATYNFYFSGFRGEEVDPYNRRKVYYVDERGRTFKIEDALGNRTWVNFDVHNRERRIRDPHDNTTHYMYDGYHNLTGVVDALERWIHNRYDEEHRLIETEDQLEHITRFTYDDEHHLLSTTDAEDNETRMEYYENGQVENSIDARDTVTGYTYDNFGAPETTRTGEHPEIQYEYDEIGRMISLTDNEGARTEFEYDDLGHLLITTDPLGRETHFEYDEAGRMTTRTDRNEDTTEYTYTPSGKLDTVTYPDDSIVHFTYNLHDKVTEMEDSLGTTTYEYDENYRLTSFTNPHEVGVSYEYDECGNLTQITYPGDRVVSYTYDVLNRIETVTTWLDQTATYHYDAVGRLIRVDNFNGTRIGYWYDDANRLTHLESRNTNEDRQIAMYIYTLDANGNRIEVEAAEPLRPMVREREEEYTYNDEKNRLLEAGDIEFTYDNEGQLATKDNIEFTFDYEHRLIGIGEDVEFSYDGKGNRLSANRGDDETRYVYDASGNLLAETNGDNEVTKCYIYGLGLLAMVTPDGDTYCYHFDGNGNTVAMTDAEQNTVNEYAYTPFGILANEDETISQPFKFAGQYGVMTEVDGLYYMRARYYDPGVGRFVSQDPIGFDGGDVNLYVYAKNNPIMFVDPNGDIPGLSGAILGAIAGGIAGGQRAGLEGAIIGAGAGAVAGFVSGLIGDMVTMGTGGGAVGAIVGGTVGGIVGEAIDPFPEKVY